MKNDTKKTRINLMDSRMIMKIHSQTWPFLSKLNMLFCNDDSFCDETIHCEHGLKTRLRRGFRCLDTIDKHCDSCWIHNLILWTFHTLTLLKFTIEDYDTQSWKLMEGIVLYTFSVIMRYWQSMTSRWLQYIDQYPALLDWKGGKVNKTQKRTRPIFNNLERPNLANKENKKTKSFLPGKGGKSWAGKSTQERIMGQRGTLSLTLGICEFHQSYFYIN